MRRPRLSALVIVLLGALVLGAGSLAPARADNCDDLPAQPEDWCHTPTPDPNATPKPPTPKPTTPPTAAPSQPPGSSTAPPAGPTRTASPSRTTSPSQTLDPVELEEPTGPTPEVVLDDFEPIDPDVNLDADLANHGGANWALFIIGLIVGGVAGRASWGLSNRRKKQHIFG